MGLVSWWQNRRAKELQRTYDELSAEFFETYTRLKHQFYELKEDISKRLGIDIVFAKRNQFYETYQRFLKVLEDLISIDKRWRDIDSKMEYLFGRGMTYLFKYESNFDYDRALSTLNRMETSLKNVEVLLDRLGLRTAA